jgi:hypothetical protein
MENPSHRSDKQRVLAQLAMPAQAPLSDKTLGAIARRAHLPVSQVEGILTELAEGSQPLVKKMTTASLGEFWIGLSAGADALG